MQSILSWIVPAALVFIAAIFFFIRAISRRSMQNIWYSLVLVLIAMGLGARAGWLFVKKSYQAVEKAVAAHTPAEVYANMFGNSSNGCVRIVHVTEPQVPRIDCCTYLEFKACPDEMKRIIAESNYKIVPSNQPPGRQPAWWMTSILGAGTVTLSCSPDEDSYQLLVFSADSTHAFYCYSKD